MTNVILILILFTIVLLLCIICGGIGFLLSEKMKPKPKEKKPAEPPTAEQKRVVEKAQREYNNFLNYDGSEQEEISY